MKYKTFIVFVFVLISHSLFAQSAKKDIYYLVDTAKIPVKDRVMEIVREDMGNNRVIVGYNFHIPCIEVEHTKTPNFIFTRGEKRKGTVITSAELKTKSLISVTDIIRLVCREGTRRFEQQYNVYFIEPGEGGNFVQYLMNTSHFTVIVDYVILKDPKAPPTFEEFLTANYKIPEEIKNDCNSHYAIIKAVTDKNGRITAYKFLTEESDALYNSFNFLRGYQFPPKMKIKQRPVVFRFSVYNLLKKCAPTQIKVTETDAVSKVFSAFNTARIENPETVFLYDDFYKVID